MKRPTIILIFLLTAFGLSAQEKMVAVYPQEREWPNGLLEMQGVRMPSEEAIKVTDDPNFRIDLTVEDAQQVQASARVKEAEKPVAGYTNPDGTLFLGYTQTGSSIFIQNPGVIGAWSYELPCWQWKNTATNYTNIRYQTLYGSNNDLRLEGKYYGVDEAGNFTDSIVAQGGMVSVKGINGDESDQNSYRYQYATPLQIVENGDNEERFVLLKAYKDSKALDSTYCSIAAGGLPTKQTADGLWPLTNAVSTNKDGVSTLLYYTDGSQKPYYFGTNKDANDQMPEKIVTYYDKPQRMLYVKSISVLLGSNGTMKLDTLQLDVLDQNGGVIAQSTATLKEAKNVTSPRGKILTFFFEDYGTYGELKHEGFSVDEPFRVEISGIKNTDNFGIYSAKSTVHHSKSETVYPDGTPAYQDCDPYIMLNGIYPTLEDYVLVNGGSYERDGDTIPIKFNPAPEGITYQYGATYASNRTYHGISQFAFYSTGKPYNAETRYWNLEIERPSYITMSSDYETHMGMDETKPTIWEYYRVFTLYIYANQTPVIGDCISISQYGRKIVFRIDELFDINKVLPQAEKKLENGKVTIRRGGNTYNALGMIIE